MQVLDKNKYGIDFINDNQEITSWKRSGNYSASNLYQEGLIEGLPFNIFPFAFSNVFDNKARND